MRLLPERTTRGATIEPASARTDTGSLLSLSRDGTGPNHSDFADAPPARAGGSRRWSSRQAQILDALEELLLREGFRHLTIAEMVEHLHCSRRTLYSLAPSREELILVVVDRLFTHMGAAARARVAACEDPGDAVAAYMETSVTRLAGAHPVFFDDLESYLPTKQLYDRHLHYALGVLGGLIEDGMRKGSFRQLYPPIVAEILDAAVERIRNPEVLTRAGASWSQALATLSELVRHGLLHVEEEPAGASETRLRRRNGSVAPRRAAR